MNMQLQWEGSLWPTLYSLLLELEEFLQQLQAAGIAELLGKHFTKMAFLDCLQQTLPNNDMVSTQLHENS